MAGTPLLAPAFPIPAAVAERARDVRLLVLDVDGVLTDGQVIFSSDDELKSFDIKDGHGIKMLQRNGVEIGIITGRTSRALERRAHDLGISHLYQGCSEKLPIYHELIQRLGLTAKQVAYAGDDVVDLPILLQVGCALTVQDAHSLVKQHAHWVTPSKGGHGAVREMAELILHAQGTYVTEMERYLVGGGRL